MILRTHVRSDGRLQVWKIDDKGVVARSESWISLPPWKISQLAALEAYAENFNRKHESAIRARINLTRSLHDET